MSLISAKDARKLFSESKSRAKHMKAVEKILDEISKEIQEASRKGARSIILNERTYPSGAAQLFWNPCLEVDYCVDYNIVRDEVKTELSNAGYTWETYNNGESRFKILW